MPSKTVVTNLRFASFIGVFVFALWTGFAWNSYSKKKTKEDGAAVIPSLATFLTVVFLVFLYVALFKLKVT
jgi:hypothetical protein